MDKIRLCVGSNDGGANIAKTHMGDTKTFYIYDIDEGSESKFIEERTNIARDMKHGTVDKMKEIIKLVEDADVFVAYEKSLNFTNIASKTKHQPVVVKAENISSILVILNKSLRELHEYINRRKNGEVFDTIPELQ